MYISLSNTSLLAQDLPVKTWNFPKMHALVHSFDDIEAKGASRNYNTKPNEKLHGPIRKFYLTRTNFKNVAPQVRCISYIIFNLISNISQTLDLKIRTLCIRRGADSGPNRRSRRSYA